MKGAQRVWGSISYAVTGPLVGLIIQNVVFEGFSKYSSMFLAFFVCQFCTLVTLPFLYKIRKHDENNKLRDASDCTIICNDQNELKDKDKQSNTFSPENVQSNTLNKEKCCPNATAELVHTINETSQSQISTASTPQTPNVSEQNEFSATALLRNSLRDEAILFLYR